MNFGKKQVTLNKIESLGQESSSALVGLTSTVDNLVNVNAKIDSEIESTQNTIALYEELIVKAKSELETLGTQKENNAIVIDNINKIIRPQSQTDY